MPVLPRSEVNLPDSNRASEGPPDPPAWHEQAIDDWGMTAIFFVLIALLIVAVRWRPKL